MDWAPFLAEAKPYLGGFGMLALALVLWFYNQKNARAIENANADGNISALSHWEKVAESMERRANEAMAENRALLKERQDQAVLIAQLQAEVGALKHVIAAQTQTLAAQTEALSALRQQIESARAGDPA